MLRLNTLRRQQHQPATHVPRDTESRRHVQRAQPIHVAPRWPAHVGGQGEPRGVWVPGAAQHQRAAGHRAVVRLCGGHQRPHDCGSFVLVNVGVATYFIPGTDTPRTTRTPASSPKRCATAPAAPSCSASGAQRCVHIPIYLPFQARS